jgi:tRNA A-37 threonylcarbamoyl transferase component Bud32
LSNRRCPRCHNHYAAPARFCPNDGTPLVEVAPAPAQVANTAQARAIERAAEPADPVYTSLTGRTLGGRYRIERRLGEGGMSYVYLAQDLETDRQVALKVLSPRLIRDPASVERLKREAAIAMRLDHPNVCPILGLGETPERLIYLVMPYLPGEPLSEHEIRQGALSVAEGVPLLLQICRGLEHAHKLEIVHRDLKPENVIVREDGSPVLVDFGLAMQVRGARGRDVLELGEGFIGTPAYMAPEQITGQKVDARADVFAFGVLMYEYASGVHPFEAANALATVARVIESDVAPLTSRTVEVGSGMAEVIARCLKKSPADRFPSAAEIADALTRQHDAIPPPTQAASWWRAHQLVVCLLYAAGAMLSWQIKAWHETPFTVAGFVALGAASAIGCVLRGHVVFTERVNRRHLATERRRTARATRLLDLIVALLLLADGILIAPVQALPGVFALSLGLGIALANIVLEPATTMAAFGDERTLGF